MTHLTTRPGAYRLREAVMDMTARYGQSMHRAGLACPDGFEGRSAEHWRRAATRQFAAIQRLTAALRDAEVTR